MGSRRGVGRVRPPSLPHSQNRTRRFRPYHNILFGSFTLTKVYSASLGILSFKPIVTAKRFGSVHVGLTPLSSIDSHQCRNWPNVCGSRFLASFPNRWISMSKEGGHGSKLGEFDVNFEDIDVIMPIHLHEILYRVKRRCLRFIRFPCNACFQEVCPVSM